MHPTGKPFLLTLSFTAPELIDQERHQQNAVKPLAASGDLKFNSLGEKKDTT